MSLAIVFKGPEGIVLAADSRVTLHTEIQIPGQSQSWLLPANFDNATKLLRVSEQNYVGAVTYGLGAIGQSSPRTAHSFMPEFEAELRKQKRKRTRGKSPLTARLGVKEFAQELSNFFLKQWNAHAPAGSPPQPGMVFFVGGVDEDAAYGRVFSFDIPNSPIPNEVQDKPGDFGVVWGGQMEIVQRVLSGFDPTLPQVVKSALNLSPQDDAKVIAALRTLTLNIPYPFLPLQDCVDLSIFLIRLTIQMQKWQVGIRGVGGFIDVATITRTEGFREVQRKAILGENITK